MCVFEELLAMVFMKNISSVLYAVFLLLSAPLLSKQDTAPNCSAVPSWVVESSFTLPDSIFSLFGTGNQFLLADYQYHLQEKTQFAHIVVKLLTTQDLVDCSQLSFYYDPSYEQLAMHQIRVYRDGQWLDKLGTSKHKLMQNTDMLKSNLYHEEMQLVYFLDDIRIGDVLEFSWSTTGENPIYSDLFSRHLSFQGTTHRNKVHRRIVGAADQELFIKNFNTTIEPTITTLPSGLKEWVWEVYSCPAYTPEGNEPRWHNPQARVQATQFKSWSEVAKKTFAAYPKPASHCPTEVNCLVEKWKGMTFNPLEQATLALRFVQDEVRYQGFFEEGSGAFIPTDPWVTFQRRYGDCKDKSFLLLSLLNQLGIESVPVLVHTQLGKNLPDLLPSPFVFNHVILKIGINGKWYWVDPTIDLQGGSLEDNYLPDYFWGLPIAETTTSLDPLPRAVLSKPVEIVSSVTIKTPETAEMEIFSTFSGLKADRIRKLCSVKGLQKIEEKELKDLKKKYGTVTSLAPLTAVDDRKNNIIIMHELFRIPVKERDGKRVLKIYSFIFEQHLDDEITQDRSAPYALVYPFWVKESILLTNPYSNWSQDSYGGKITTPSFYFALASVLEGKQAGIQIEIKHLEDHVPTDAVNEYYETINEISSHSIDEIVILSSKR